MKNNYLDAYLRIIKSDNYVIPEFTTPEEHGRILKQNAFLKAGNVSYDNKTTLYENNKN